MNVAENPSALAVRAPIDDTAPIEAVSRRGGRLMQDVVPWATSLVVHAGLIVLSVATATVILAPPKPPHEEQTVIASSSLNTDGPTFPVSAQSKGLADLAAETRQDVDPAAADGLARDRGPSIDVTAASGGEGAADLIAIGSNQFSIGGKGNGPGSGTDKGAGGELAQWGLPQKGGNAGDGSSLFIPGWPSNTRKVIFVCDATGTMIQKMGALKQELVKAIGNLRPVQSFNVVFFTDGGKFQIASKGGLLMANPQNKRLAYEFLENVTPTGTTDPLPALAAAFQQSPDLLYFLSDGEFNNLIPYEEVASRIQTLRGGSKTRVNTILFDSYDRQAEETMQKIAKENGGAYRYVREADLR